MNLHPPSHVRHTGVALRAPVSESAATIAAEAAGEEDLGDLLLAVLPGDGSSLGNLAAGEAYEAVKEPLLAMVAHPQGARA
jgi:hypothetical protein